MPRKARKPRKAPPRILRVIIESPYRADTHHEWAGNNLYVKFCMRDSLLRNEAPFASHLLYAASLVLDDSVPEERERGIRAGYLWGELADLHAFYTDRGWSTGMMLAYMKCLEHKQTFELRSIHTGVTPTPFPGDTVHD